MGYVISLWHSLSLPYNYFDELSGLRSSKPMYERSYHFVDLCQILKKIEFKTMRVFSQ